jgi:FMN-dependent NADH-azoreductase
MSNVLALTSSALGAQSASSQLVQFALERFQSENPAAKIVVRDLGLDHIPHLNPDSAAVLRGGEPANPEQVRALALSDELVAELKAADTLMIGAPMYNFGISTTLKAWFDYVLRAGVTFRYGEAGPVGLVTGKRALVALSRGGLYSEGPGQAMDFQEPHLRGMLRFIGIEDVSVVRAERLGFGPEMREQAIAAARAEIEAAVQGKRLLAA